MFFDNILKVMNRLVCMCEEKMLFVEWNCYIWWSKTIILSELIIKCEIGRFSKFGIILEDHWKWYKRTNLFNVQYNRHLYMYEIFFSKPMRYCWIWWFEFIFLVILNEEEFSFRIQLNAVSWQFNNLVWNNYFILKYSFLEKI
jgi:hypothetical protein